MAFTTSNVKGGVEGDLKYYAGDWTGSANDDYGTITLRGGGVYVLSFINQDEDQAKEPVNASVSVSSGTITIKVFNHMDVASGRFFIKYA